MFELAKKANVLPHQFAKALGVGRVTVSLWFNGHSKPHKILADRVSTLVVAIEQAVEAGELPVSADLNRRERNDETHKVLVRHMELVSKEANQISLVS